MDLARPEALIIQLTPHFFNPPNPHRPITNQSYLHKHSNPAIVKMYQGLEERKQAIGKKKKTLQDHIVTAEFFKS